MSANDPTVQEVFDSMTDMQKEALYAYVYDTLTHEKVVRDYEAAFSFMSEEQKTVCNFIIYRAKEKAALCKV